MLPGSTSGSLRRARPLRVYTSEFTASWKAPMMNQLSTIAYLSLTDGNVDVIGMERKAKYLK